MTKNRHFKIFIITVCATLFSYTEGMGQYIRPDANLKEKTDTVKEDNPFAVPDSLRKRRNLVNKDSLKTVNAMDYIMDTRYLTPGDSLSKGRWYRDLFLQMGIGAERVFPPTQSYKFNTLTTFHFGLGKQFGKYHSLRLLVDAALGYQQDYDRMYVRIGGQLDHLFDLSSYINGYNPARLLGVATVVGVGLHHAQLRRTGRHSNPYEAHGGLQFRFYTGPHGMLNIEPYVALASDGIDLSQSRNWHRYDITYGVNANFVYYFDNHLSRAARNRMIMKTKAKDPNLVTADSTRLYAWQSPWLIELAGGISAADIPGMSMSQTMGYEWALGAGKWLSPVIGLRASAMLRNTTWAKRTQSFNQITYEEDLHSYYVGARLEGMLNPLGFLHSFRWDAPIGFYLVGGAGLGWLVKQKDSPSLHCWSESFTAGLHLWARLTDGLQFFIEPRYTYNVYNVPYKNVKWSANYSDNTYGVNVGFTATNITHRYRKYETSDEPLKKRMVAGLGGGMHLILSNSQYVGKSSVPFNINGFFEYRFNHYSSARVGLEFLRHTNNDYMKFYDLNMSLPEYNYAPIQRHGLWSNTYYLGMAALNYELNLTNAFCGYRPGRLFNFDIFFGPGLSWSFGRKSVLDEREPLRVNHEARPIYDAENKVSLAVNGGAKFSVNVFRGIGITITPQLYYVPSLEIQGLKMGRLKVLGTLDLGLQYQF